jgi:hypothetical protein
MRNRLVLGKPAGKILILLGTCGNKWRMYEEGTDVSRAKKMRRH